MKRTILQRQVQVLSEDLREISEMLGEEEAEATKVAKENEERSKRGEPLAPYRAMRRGEIKRLLEFVEERLSNTIKVLGLEENLGQGLPVFLC
ncbi:unnamed protein product [marine sediment metagenome]|uniref:Uncharacterized protein n=1 Tax=marine sediment metagenome TaxID=412755 RepID=X1SXC9_9ZZZZ